MNTSTQVLVIGGGPAGSTAATLLAREGFDVTLIERDVFPRYHIGESLLPSVLEILDLIGAREKIEAHGFIKKEGGWFSWGKDSWELNFKKLRHPYGFQVIRSEFDHMLLEHSKSLGVKVFEGIEVKSLNFDGDRPRSANWSQVVGGNDSGEISFDYLIDASGRTAMMGMRYLKNRHYHNAFQNVAVWGYYKGAGTMAWAPNGAIAIGAIVDGWLWGIPLHDGTMSVGLIMDSATFKERRKQISSIKDIYLNAVEESQLMKDLLKDAELVSTELLTDQDFSYMSDNLSGPGYFMAGDAACFIDPLLSTGVHLATHGATLAAASIASLLRGEVTEQEALTFYEQSYRHAYLRLMVIISGLYQQYNGSKESYFWQAQQLTHNDYDNAEALNEAFLFVVSGMEDVNDTAHAHREVIMAELTDKLPKEDAERAIAIYNVYNKVFLRSSMSEETATESGFYVVTKPHLGLAQTNQNEVRSA